MKDVTNAEMDANVLKEQRAREVREAEIQIQIAAEEKNIELAKKKAERKEAELLETVVKPSQAEKERARLAAEAQKVAAILKAEADAEARRLDAAAQAEAKKLDAVAQAERIKQEGLARQEITAKQGEAQAEAVRQMGLAEAETLEKKAEALAKMNDAGKLQMVIEKLPEIAAAVAEPEQDRQHHHHRRRLRGERRERRRSGCGTLYGGRPEGGQRGAEGYHRL